MITIREIRYTLRLRTATRTSYSTWSRTVLHSNRTSLEVCRSTIRSGAITVRSRKCWANSLWTWRICTWTLHRDYWCNRCWITLSRKVCSLSRSLRKKSITSSTNSDWTSITSSCARLSRSQNTSKHWFRRNRWPRSRGIRRTSSSRFWRTKDKPFSSSRKTTPLSSYRKRRALSRQSRPSPRSSPFRSPPCSLRFRAESRSWPY